MPFTSVNIYTTRQYKTGSQSFDPTAFQVTSPATCYKLVQQAFDLQNSAVEQFGIITLNIKHIPIGLHIIGIGALNRAQADTREVYQAALLNNAYAIIAFHNHPSGDPFPSPDDFLITRRLRAAGELMRIQLLDHLVIGEGKYFSFREEKLM